MKIAIATKDFRQIAGHAGQSQHWLVYEGTQPGQTPQRIELSPAQVFHVHRDGAHPLDGIGVIIAGSAGDGFLRRMQKRGDTVALTALKLRRGDFRAGRRSTRPRPGWWRSTCAAPASHGISRCRAR